MTTFDENNNLKENNSKQEYIPKPRGRPRKYFTEEEYNEAKRINSLNYYYNNRAKMIERTIEYNKNRTEKQLEAERARKKEYYKNNREKCKQKIKECKEKRKLKDKLEAEQRIKAQNDAFSDNKNN